MHTVIDTWSVKPPRSAARVPSSAGTFLRLPQRRSYHLEEALIHFCNSFTQQDAGTGTSHSSSSSKAEWSRGQTMSIQDSDVSMFWFEWLRSEWRKWIKSTPSFERLVLGWIEADFCKWILVWKLLTRSTRLTYFCTAQTANFKGSVSNFFDTSISKMNFQTFHCLQQMLPFVCSTVIKCCRNFGNVLRKWKTISRCAEFAAKFCEISLKFPKRFYQIDYK